MSRSGFRPSAVAIAALIALALPDVSAAKVLLYFETTSAAPGDVVVIATPGARIAPNANLGVYLVPLNAAPSVREGALAEDSRAKRVGTLGADSGVRFVLPEIPPGDYVIATEFEVFTPDLMAAADMRDSAVLHVRGTSHGIISAPVLMGSVLATVFLIVATWAVLNRRRRSPVQAPGAHA